MVPGFLPFTFGSLGVNTQYQGYGSGMVPDPTLPRKTAFGTDLMIYGHLLFPSIFFFFFMDFAPDPAL